MKKFLKIAIVLFAILILLAIGLTLLVRSYLSSDKLKAILLPKAEELTGRKVQLEEIQVSLFKGIVVKGLHVKERDGQEDFLKMGKFVLSYRLLPLLKKQLVINKIEILSPSVAIKKERGGKYNFSDISEKQSYKPQEPSPPEPQGLPFSILSDQLFIRDARLSYVDEEKEMPDVSLTLDAEFKGAIGQDGKPRMESGRISLKEMKVALKGNDIKTSGKIDMDANTIRADLLTTIGKESVNLSATVKDYLSAPDITANLRARSLDLQNLIVWGGDKKPPEATPKKREKKAGVPKEEGMAMKLKASGQIAIDSARYQDYTIKDFRMNYRYTKGVMKIEPLGLQFVADGSFQADGSLDGNLWFAGEELQKTLKGKADVKLGKGSIKQSPVFEAIAFLTGISSLKHPSFDQGLFQFEIREEKVFIDGWIASSLFKLSPKGVAHFDKRLDLPTELKISPGLTGSLDRKLTTIKWIEDEQGWKVIPLRIKGTAEKPSVTLDEEVLGKQLGRTLIKGVERLLQERTTEDSEKTKKRKSKDFLKELFKN
jgi:AsmA protein